MFNATASIRPMLSATLLGISVCANAATCLTIENLKGKAAYSHEDYAMTDDGFSGPLRFCYEVEQGRFENNPGVFHFFGSSTWIWFNAVEETEIAEVWTFDFVSRKALFARTRGVGSLFPATVGAFVGDITATENR